MGIMNTLRDAFGGNSSNIDDANASKVHEMQKTADQYRAYRPEQAQAHMNALSNRSQAYQGANNVLASMYGPGGSQAPSQMLHNPMSNTMMGLPAEGGVDGTAAGAAGGSMIGADDGPTIYGGPDGVTTPAPHFESQDKPQEPYKPTTKFKGTAPSGHKPGHK